MPLIRMSKDMAAHIGEKVGQVMDVDLGSSGLCLKPYLRVKVVVDLTKSLRRVARLVVNLDEAHITMLLAYEKLHNICMNCEIIGHLVRECSLIPPEVSMSQTRSGHILNGMRLNVDLHRGVGVKIVLYQ